MKVRFFKRRKQKGSVLFVSLLLTAIAGFLMLSYLSMINTQNLSVARGQAWNKALTVAEAGVEEALAHLNSSGVSLANLAINSWVTNGTSTVLKTNSVGDSYSAVSIIATSSSPVVVSVAYVPGPISGPALSRTVVVNCKANTGTGIAGAMVVSSTADMKGFGITTDSFNSTNTTLFPGGLYNSTNALDHGDVVTLSSAANSLNVGNGKIKGSARTIPGGTLDTGSGGTVTVGSGGSVGDKSYVNGGSQGVEMTPTAHFTADASYSLPDATLPTNAFWYTPVAGSYKVNGVTYKYLLNNTKPWKLSNLDGSVYFSGAGVQLWVTTGISLGSQDEIRIGGAVGSGSVYMYVSVPNATIGGNGIINDTGYAKAFNYYGLPANTALSFSANAAFVGRIYAPEAAFTLGGGGKNTYDFVGQSITKSVVMNGHFNFHYDEASSFGSSGSGFVVTSWKEPSG